MRVTTIAVVVAVIASNGPAHAEPFRLRADALGQAGAPTGVVSLSAEADPTRWAEAEALIWAGTNESDSEMDVLVVAISIRDPERGHQARLGRMIASLGALRPVHLDGVSGHLRMSSGTVFEAFGGIPVKPRFGRPDYDWLAGARVAQSITRFGTAGVAYLHRRDAGRLSDQEVGADFSLTPHEALGLSGRITYDLVNPGVSEAIGFIAFRASRAWRFEVRGTHRSPSRILPATSLFSVLGDVPSRYVGGRARWQAAPRLDLIAEGGLRAFDSLVAEDGRLRGVLRLDPLGRSSVSLEASRRSSGDGGGWTGGRGALDLAVHPDWRIGVELELVRPDRPALRGSWWPWGLVALSWRPTRDWELAAAVEGSMTAEQTRSIDALFRVAYHWRAP